MNALFLAIVMMALLLSTAYRLARWVKTEAPQKVKDRLLFGLVILFALGAFFCFPVWLAAPLVATAAACVSADFFIRRGGSSVDKK